MTEIHKPIISSAENWQLPLKDPEQMSTEEEVVFRRDNLLKDYVQTPEVTALGPVILRTDIKSLEKIPGSDEYREKKIQTLPEYKTVYPPAITTALGELYTEYNRAFMPLVDANTEWDEDYRFCKTGTAGSIRNIGVQIDMVGLPANFLKEAERMDPKILREVLRKSIFEIENSLAMYQLTEKLFSDDSGYSVYGERFRYVIDSLRRQHSMPIALLAVTEGKYNAIRQSEFGKRDGEPLTDDEVMQLSGFDRLLGPVEFAKLVEEKGEDIGHLLYVRSSYPPDKLKKPGISVSNPLLEDAKLRRIIKAHSLTPNIDNPEWGNDSDARINDTKEYMISMGMAHPVFVPEDAWTATVVAKGKQPILELNDQLKSYLMSQGVDPKDVTSGAVNLRAKPMKASYGCFGHAVIDINNGKDRKALSQGLTERGPYVIQPEMTVPSIQDLTSGERLGYIDRNFMAMVNDKPVFLGGIRICLPTNSAEASSRRFHGSDDSRYGEIVDHV